MWHAPSLPAASVSTCTHGGVVANLVIILTGHTPVWGLPDQVIRGEKTLPHPHKCGAPSRGSPDERRAEGKLCFLPSCLCVLLARSSALLLLLLLLLSPLPLTSHSGFFGFPTWTEDQWLSWNHPGLQHWGGTAETRSLSG